MAEAEEGAAAYVLAENLSAVNLFNAVTTQWRSSGFGATGLDYHALESVMNFRRIPAKERRDLFEDVRVLEEAALLTMQEFRNNG